MLTSNLCPEVALVNGACGTVVGIIKPDDARKLNVRVAVVDFPAYCGHSLSRQPNSGPDHEIRALDCKGMVLTLAWVITISKAQHEGMALDWIIVDLSRKLFASSLMFEAL
jgi:hypothetical protein